jgi:hypothetical protein
MRQIGGNVRRIGRAIEILRVAAIAIHGKALKFPSDVTIRALQFRVHAREGEARHSGVIE